MLHKAALSELVGLGGVIAKTSVNVQAATLLRGKGGGLVVLCELKDGAAGRQRNPGRFYRKLAWRLGRLADAWPEQIRLGKPTSWRSNPKMTLVERVWKLLPKTAQRSELSH